MELTHESCAAVPPAQAWAVLTDLERIAPCMPGAQLQEVEGDVYRGIVKIKVGPITAQYKGKATFLEQDEPAGRLVLRAEGRDTRGQGNANATITATLAADGDGTKVIVGTDLTVTGKVAQFGRGVLADVSAKLLAAVRDLPRDQGAGRRRARSRPRPPRPRRGPPRRRRAPPAPSGASTPGGDRRHRRIPWSRTAPPSTGDPNGDPNGSACGCRHPTVRKINQPEAEPVNLIDTAGGSIAKRAGPIAIVVAVVFVLLRRRRRRSRRNR